MTKNSFINEGCAQTIVLTSGLTTKKIRFRICKVNTARQNVPFTKVNYTVYLSISYAAFQCGFISYIHLCFVYINLQKYSFHEDDEENSVNEPALVEPNIDEYRVVLIIGLLFSLKLQSYF